MNRRLLFTLLLALPLTATAALSQTWADRIARDLRREGFSEVSTSQTLLGRTRIFARGPEGTREIILDPRTGEILRDLWRTPTGAPTNPYARRGDDEDDGRPSGSSSLGDGDDDEDDGDDEGGDDDDDDGDDDDDD